MCASSLLFPDALLNAALTVLERQRGASTLDAVAAEAGVSKDGLLRHFPSKAMLLELLSERALAQHDAWMEREASRTGLRTGLC